MLVGLLIVALVVAVSYGLYKHYGSAAIKAELEKLVQEGETDASEIYARLKAKL